MKRTLYIAARSSAGAECIARAIDAGRAADNYRTPEAAAARAAELSDPGTRHWAYEVTETATPDGRTRVAKLIETVSEFAAAALIVFGGCWAVGVASTIGGAG